jgi:Fe-S-cluster containining protein
MSEDYFYADGLRFSCTRCSSCCRHESGYVYLSENDLSLLVQEFGMNYTEFIKTFCRWIPFPQGRDRLSLKEKSNFDCVFWKDGNSGCLVYRARPLQCRAFPFWDSVVCSGEAWKNAGKSCPGIDAGAAHNRAEIEHYLNSMNGETVIERDAPKVGE